MLQWLLAAAGACAASRLYSHAVSMTAPSSNGAHLRQHRPQDGLLLFHVQSLRRMDSLLAGVPIRRHLGELNEHLIIHIKEVLQRREEGLESLLSGNGLPLRIR